MAELIASELRGSDESANEAANISKSKVRRTRSKKSQSRVAAQTLETHNSFNSLPVEEASDAEDNSYDELPALDSVSDSESDDDMEGVTNEEV